jgi:hypothetical protein
VVKADFEDKDSLLAAFQGCDAVIAVTGEPPLHMWTECSLIWYPASVYRPTVSDVPQSRAAPAAISAAADFWVACGLDPEREKKQGGLPLQLPWLPLIFRLPLQLLPGCLFSVPAGPGR